MKKILNCNIVRNGIALILVLVLALGIDVTSKTSVYAALNTNQEEEIQTILEQYFAELFEVLLEDSDVDYSSNDFSSINGYIIAKNLVNTRQTYNKLLGGIHNVDIQEIVIDDLSENEDELEAMVYVKYLFTYGEDTEDEQCTTGTLYRVILETTENSYTVTDIDNTDIEIQRIKDALNNEKTRSTEDNFNVVDVYFEEIQKNADSLLETTDIVEVEDTEDGEYETTSVSTSYNVTKARNYGYKLGDNYNNYIFKRASLDCTNFVSQCVWSGYGGASGYTIPEDPSLNNETCVALKNRVKSDYRMTSSWYGRNYDSTLGDPPSNFCGVVSFYDYVTTNSGNGPQATAYNNGKVYTNLSVKMKKGDVLQFYDSDAGRYYHSVIVVSTTDYSVSDYQSVKVAQHESEYNNRNLSELITNFGGSSCKMRLLRFNLATFAE